MRTRILLAFVVLLAFASILSIVLLREALNSRTADRVEDELRQEVDEFNRLARDGRNPETGRPFGADVRSMFEVFLDRNVPSAGEVIYTFVDGRPFRASRDTTLPGGAFDALEELGDVTRPVRREVRVDDERLRALAVPVIAEGEQRGVFLVTGDLAQEQEETNDAVRIAAIISGFALLLAAGLAYGIAGRVLRPLREVTSTAQAISEEDLERRIPVEGHDEIAELGTTFNAMLDRLQSTFDAQRSFLSDAGHELRTPITIIRGHLELLGDDPQERADTLALVDDELERMTRLVDDLLTLAKAERPDFLRLDELDLDVLTDELHAKAEQLGEREWVRERIGAGRLRGDRQRLTQAVMNLAANAVDATQPGGRIGIGSELRPDGEVRIWVTDDGRGVPAEERERIFERFHGRGSGLGLAITQVIAEAHGGRVILGDGPGTTFTLSLPAEPPPEVG